MTKRDWTTPRAKIEAEDGRCRVCGDTPAEAAHIIARSRVRPGPGEDHLNIVPLCRKHHTGFDAHCFDLLPYLTLEEQAFAVSLVGLVEANRRLSGRVAAA